MEILQDEGDEQEDDDEMMSIGLVQDAKPHLPFKLGAQQQSTSHLKSDASTVNISCRY